MTIQQKLLMKYLPHRMTHRIFFSGAIDRWSHRPRAVRKTPMARSASWLSPFTRLHIRGRRYEERLQGMCSSLIRKLILKKVGLVCLAVFLMYETSFFVSESDTAPCLCMKLLFLWARVIRLHVCVWNFFFVSESDTAPCLCMKLLFCKREWYGSIFTYEFRFLWARVIRLHIYVWISVFVSESDTAPCLRVNFGFCTVEKRRERFCVRWF